MTDDECPYVNIKTTNVFMTTDQIRKMFANKRKDDLCDCKRHDEC